MPDFGRIALGVGTQGLSEVWRGLSGGRPGGGASVPIPYDRGAGKTVDPAMLSQAFNQALGRNPEPDELEFFSQFIKNGDLGYEEIGQILSGGPEAGEQRLEDYTGRYENRLRGSDDYLLGRAADTATQKFLTQGRGDTSALGAQIASAGQGLASDRQRLLADFYGGGLTGLQNQYANRGTAVQNRGYALGDARTQYNRDLDLSVFGYNTQKKDYNEAMNLQNYYQKQNALFGLLGAGVGAGLGGAAGGKYGALLGAGIGKQAGGILTPTPRY